MKYIDKLEEIDNKIETLRTNVKRAETIEEIENAMAEIETLKDEKQNLLQTEDVNMHKQATNYLETDQAVHDLIEIQKNAPKRKDERDAYIKNAWEAKLVENGLTITDKDSYLPKRLQLDIQTILTRPNTIFPIFKHTNLGAILVAREFTSADEAKVHKPGTQKEHQNSTLKVSKVDPRMIYKLAGINEIDKRTIENFDELYQLLVAELAQRVVDKVVDLALVEGSATESGTGSADAENGFISILNETNENKVKRIPGKTDIVAALEEAVDSIEAPGKKYLIVTKAQKRAILDAVRKKFPTTTFFNQNQTIADTFGFDELLIYQGTKPILPTVIAENAYHVDMQPLNRIEQFRLDTNENDILVETVAAGRAVEFGGIAVVDTSK